LVGGLQALQAAAITTGLPFAVVMVLACASLARALRAEAPLEAGRAAASPVLAAPESSGTGDWRGELARMLTRPRAASPSQAARRRVAEFVAQVLVPAFEDVG